jgi:hypothetical protein
MNNPIRASDVSLLAATIVPVSQKISAQLVTANETYLDLVSKVPDWFFWLSVGFAIAVWIYESAKDGSRVRQLFNFLTRKFEVEDLVVANWSGMPETDVGVRIKLRFLKTMRPLRLKMHVSMCSDTGRPALKEMFDLSIREATKDQSIWFTIVTAGKASAGWDHELKRGWGRKCERRLIGGAGNVVTIECEGIFTQRHKIYIRLCDGGGKLPSIFATHEDIDIYDKGPMR